PGLNCYSCPGAVGSCPIGSLQAVLGSKKYDFAAYVLGTLLVFGVVLGRFVCGFLCPFGFVQDLLHKIPLPKRSVPRRVDRLLRWVKYAVLAAVIALPLLLTNEFGIASPYFCKWVCPAGTLEGGIPLVALDAGLRQSVGGLFFWKLSVLVICVVASIALYRPFCKYICPLGAVYALFNRFSFYQMKLDRDKCISCGACERQCPMQVDVTRQINSAECIRCGKCKDVCPTQAITSGFRMQPNATSTHKEHPKK
ncbi:MAG: 4Fe-4S binding protein, partial [Eubacteriales bacterium]|nr:4Fe-4S binding protein [Eubacteriales bacterium]